MHPIYDDKNAASATPLLNAQAIGIERVIESITSIVNAETLALKNNQQFDISTMNMRKARLLVDLSAAVKSVEIHQISPQVQQKMQRMRAALAQNLSQYHAHAFAVKEIIQMILEAAHEQHNDGTYNARKPR